MRHYSIQSDTSLELGGQDQAPKPTEYLVAALAACTSITIKMYLNVKKWSVEKLSVDVNYFKAPDKTQWIERVIWMKGDFSPEQLQRILDVSNKCPVHKLLEKGIEMRTRLG